MKKRYVLILLMLLFSTFVLSGCFENSPSEQKSGGSGIITEKFREGSTNYYIDYYFVIDDEFDIKVSRYKYYNYSVGDSYNWSK